MNICECTGIGSRTRLGFLAILEVTCVKNGFFGTRKIRKTSVEGALDIECIEMEAQTS